jgi:endonuclease/exonuclease/phosphatase family metal-dependent hydrolase
MADIVSSLSILTLNVWNREGPWAQRLPLIKSWIHRLEPDLIGLQEVVDPNHTQELLRECDFHSEWMGHDFRHSQRRTMADSPSARALVARGWQVHARSGAARHGELALRNHFIHFCDHILSHDAPRLQTRATNAGTQRVRVWSRKGRVSRILVGDFNTDPESAEIRYLKGLQSLQGKSAYWCDAWDHGDDANHLVQDQ